MGRAGPAPAAGAAGKAQAPANGPRATSQAPASGAKHDPLVITLDLRRLSPTNWGAGAKALSMAVLLLAAFVLGGYAGITFERTRDDLGAGIDEVKSLGRSQEDAGATDGTTDPAGSNTPDAGVSGDNDTDPGGAGSDPGAGDGGDGPDGGDGGNGDGGLGDGGSGSDPDAAQTRTVFTLSGEGEARTSTFTTEQDLLRVRIDFHSEDSTYRFSVRFMQDGESRPAKTLTASKPGQYTGVDRYVSVPAGTYYLDFEFKPGDDPSYPPWDIVVEEPRGEAASDPPDAFTGRGDGAPGPVLLDGTHTISMQAAGYGKLDIRAYAADGTRLRDCDIREGVSNDPSGSTTCSVAGPTKVHFDVVAPHGSDTWRLEIG